MAKTLQDYLNGIENITDSIVSDSCYSHETVEVIDRVASLILEIKEIKRLLTTGQFKGDKGDKGDRDEEYTFIADIPSNISNNKSFTRIYDHQGSSLFELVSGDELYNNRGRRIIKKFSIPNDMNKSGVTIRLYANTNANTGDIFALSNIMVLKGDYTNKNIEYFIGMKEI